MKIFPSSILVSILVQLGRAEELCTSANNTFTVKVDLFAGELGYYYFEECGTEVNPTIGLEIGETYTFLQGDRSNYYHPLGFAYFPDGAHAGLEELEPGVTLTEGNTCADKLSCPAPMYFKNGEYVGVYSNIPDVTNVTTGKGNFGLDDYEPLFFHPITEWTGYGPFSIQLKFDDANYTKDLFYFCHIHQFMSGRIKLLQDGQPVSEEDDPALGYEYDTPTEYDRSCGTFNLDAFQLPHSQCPDRFVCETDGTSNENLREVSGCFDSMNCAMMAGMTTNAKSDDPVALFIHQMIPHHQNAVNMAKTMLLKGNQETCDDLTSDSDACVMEQIFRSIVNNQNMQIQQMRAYLVEYGLPAEDDCQLTLERTNTTGNGTDYTKGNETDPSTGNNTDSNKGNTTGNVTETSAAAALTTRSLFASFLAATVAIWMVY